MRLSRLPLSSKLKLQPKLAARPVAEQLNGLTKMRRCAWAATLLLLATGFSPEQPRSWVMRREGRIKIWGSGRPKRRKESSLDREERLAAKNWQKQQHRDRARRAAKTTPTKPKKSPDRSKTSSNSQSSKLVERRQVRLRRRVEFNELQHASLVGSFDDVFSMPQWQVPEVAFVGRSNTGKSSMLNALVGSRKAVAIAGKRPGRTRRINLFELRDSRGTSCAFTDLPGYGYASLSKEEQLRIGRFVTDYLDHRRQLALVVLIVDARRSPNEYDADLDVFDTLRSRRTPVALVATKIDKFNSGTLLHRRLVELNSFFQLPPNQPFYFSALTKQGRPELWHLINEYLTASAPTGLLQPAYDQEKDKDDTFGNKRNSQEAANSVLLEATKSLELGALAHDSHHDASMSDRNDVAKLDRAYIASAETSYDITSSISEEDGDSDPILFS